MVKKAKAESVKDAAQTRGGSVSKEDSKKVSKDGHRRKIVDPMLVNAKKAEEHNLVLDEALADLESDLETAGTEAAEADVAAESADLSEVETGFDEEYYNNVLADDEEVKDILDISDDELEKSKKKSRKEKRVDGEKPQKGYKKNGKRKMKLWKKILIGFLVLLLAALGYAGWYIFSALSKTTSVFSGNALDIFVPAKLAEDSEGRTNVLVFGTSEDEEGHGGAMLADSILVLSVNQNTKEARTFSIPRDLWVNYTVAGEDTLFCTVGYKGKINAEYMCALNEFEDVDKASRYFARKVSEVTGVNVQYYVAVDWTVLRSVVDALGGIDVDVWATDEDGISDVCQQIRMHKGMNYGLNGDMALRLARARGACTYAPGGITQNFGLSNSNFDREKNQQRIINAIKNKALSVGVLADPTKVLTMIDALGQNVKTNITMSEVRTVLDIAMGLNGEIESIETQSLFSTGNINGQSSVVPAGAPLDSNASGLYNYTRLRAYFAEKLAAIGNSKPEGEGEGATDAGEGEGE